MTPVKQANPQGADTAEALMMASVPNAARADALRRIFGLGVGSLALGGGFAALRGLGRLYDGTHGSPPTVPVPVESVTVPYPMRRKKQADGPLAALAAHAREKRADPAPAAPAMSAADYAGYVRKNLPFGRILNGIGLMPRPGEGAGMLEPVVNSGAISHLDMPWAYPAAAAAVAGGLYFGHKGVTKALDWSQDREDDSELDVARKRYEAALGGRGLKTAASAGLDRLYDLLAAREPEKRADEGESSALGRFFNGASGAYLTALGGTALLSGMGAYNYAKGRSEDKAVAEAIRQRRERIFAQRPQALELTPVGVPPDDDDAPAPPGPQWALPGPKVASLAKATSAALGRFQARDAEARARLDALTGNAPPAPKAAPAAAAPPPLPPSVGRPG